MDQQVRLKTTKGAVKAAKAKGGTRKGAGRPKGSLSKISVKTRRQIADEFAKHAHKALNYYVRVLDGVDENGEPRVYDPSLKMQCADRILDRGIGKAVSQIELTGAEGKDLIPEQTQTALNSVPPDQLETMKQLLMAMATPTQPGDDAIIIDQVEFPTEEDDEAFLK